ncbi:leucyl/phenylalanyl-tRNA--protein transferase [Blastococcus saxobsidens]|nr:leucyl/phenylalanyl-tRNA--protein transferase [Blastococcus saxobsidens]
MARTLREVARGDLVRVTTGVGPQALLRGAAAGRFPFPRSEDSRLIPWYCPRERAVLTAGTVHLGRTLERRLKSKGWATSADEAFDEVVGHCADRPDTWITGDMRVTYAELHRRGLAHSIEVWSPDGRLIGGTFGVQTGGLFSAESLFHTEDHASKVALVDLADRVRSGGGVGIDCQYITPHTKALGTQVVDRATFLQLLGRARGLPARLPTERLPAARLLDVARGEPPAR